MKQLIQSTLRKGNTLALAVYPDVTQCLLVDSSSERLEIKMALTIESDAIDQDWVKAQGFNGSNTLITFSVPSFAIHEIDLPKMPEDEIQEALQWQLASQVSGDIHDYSIRYSRRIETEGEDGKIPLLTYSARKQETENLFNRFQKILLKPLLLEPHPVSLSGCWPYLQLGPDVQTILLVEAQRQQTLVSAIHNGELALSRKIKAFANSTENDGQFYEEAVALQNVIDTYSVIYPQLPIQHIYISGPKSNDPQLIEYLNANIGIATEQIAFNEKIQFPEAAGNPSDYSTALGIVRWPEDKDET